MHGTLTAIPASHQRGHRKPELVGHDQSSSFTCVEGFVAHVLCPSLRSAVDDDGGDAANRERAQGGEVAGQSGNRPVYCVPCKPGSGAGEVRKPHQHPEQPEYAGDAGVQVPGILLAFACNSNIALPSPRRTACPFCKADTEDCVPCQCQRCTNREAVSHPALRCLQVCMPFPSGRQAPA